MTSTTRLKLDSLLAQQEDIASKIKQLQETCQHPEAIVKYRGDTGNWDKGDDCYWIDNNCPDCNKYWRVEQ